MFDSVMTVIMGVMPIQMIVVLFFQMFVFFSSKKTNIPLFIGMTALYALVPGVGLIMVIISAAMSVGARGGMFVDLAEGYRE
jgi:hypothetical protein